MPSWFSSSKSSSHRPSYARSSSSSHGSWTRGSSSSYYKRRPRDGYISRLIYKLKHLLRELWNYARRNPLKVVVFVIMPLISGGVLAGMARAVGIQLPSFLMGKAGHYNSRSGYAGGGYYGSQGYGGEGPGLGGLANIAAEAAGGGSLGSLMSIAKAFM